MHWIEAAAAGVTPGMTVEKVAVRMAEQRRTADRSEDAEGSSASTR